MAETNDISTIESEIIELRKRIDVLSDSIGNSVEPHDTYLKEIININNRLNNLEIDLVKHNMNSKSIEDASQDQIYRHVNPVPKRPLAKPVKRQPKRKGILDKISEINFGKYIIGILASILILVALTLFIKSIWYNIPLIIKFFGIEILGLAMLILGVYKVYQGESHNGFWTSLASCGSGILFIGIISGHLVWNLYGFIMAAILIMAWFIGLSFVAFKTKSIVFYIVSYCGSLISTGLIIESLGDSIVQINNQILYILVICIWIGVSELGRIKQESEINYLSRANYIFNIGLLIITNLLIQACQVYNYENSVYEPSSIRSICILQILMAIMLLTKIQNLQYAIANKVLFWVENILGNQIGLIFLLVGMTSIFGGYDPFESEYALLIAVLALLILMCLVIYFPSKSQTQILCNSPIIALLIMSISYRLFDNELILLTVVAALLNLLINCNNELNNTKMIITELIIYVISFALYLDSSYHGEDIKLKLIVLIEFTLMASVPIINYVKSVRLDKNEAFGCQRLLDISLFGILAIPFAITFNIDVIHIAAIFTLLFIAHRLLIMDNTAELVGYRLIEEVFTTIIGLVLSGIVYLYALLSNILNSEALVLVSITAILIEMASTNLYLSLKYRSWIRSLIALISWNLNIFVIAGIWEKSELVMLISLMGILISALFITLGFIFSNKSLRVMGIVTLIIYVLKIVVFDISYSSGSNTNIFMMALGGIVCFALSFIYNKLDKIYGEDE